jgi:hypothetical protein
MGAIYETDGEGESCPKSQALYFALRKLIATGFAFSFVFIVCGIPPP